MNRQTRRRLQHGLIGFSVLTAIAVLWEFVPTLSNLERGMLDLRYRHFNRAAKASPQVVFIDIDEQSLKLLGESYGRWPWPRRAYKDLIEFVSAGEPAGVFFDIYFTEPQNNGDDDKLLASASAGGKGLGSHAMNLLIDRAEEKAGINPLPSDFASRFALKWNSGKSWQQRTIAEYRDYLLPNSTLYPEIKKLHVTSTGKDPDGVFRQAPLIFKYGDSWIPSLALAGVLSTLQDPTVEAEGQILHIRGANGPEYRVPLTTKAALPIHYYRVDRAPERIPFVSVITSAAALQSGQVSDPSQLKVNPLEFQNKVIIVGGSAAGLEDLKASPVSDAYPGALLHATAVSNILQQDYLRQAPWGSVRLPVAILFLLIAYFAVMFLDHIGLKVGVPIGLLLIYNVIAVVIFRRAGIWIDMALPTIGVLAATFDGLAFVSFVEGAERKRVKSTLIKFVSPTVAEAMIASGKDPSAEVGHTEELTVLFSDIRGFTTMSEKYEPAFLVEWLNQYFARMTAIIFEKEGTLDKFIGDAVMAFWGAPIAQKDHASRAISSAFRMRKALDDLLIEWDAKYQGRVKIAAGIGINSGKVVVGNIGSDMRLSYTVIGDNVNLASRIEGLTKQYHVSLLVGSRTQELAASDFIFRKVDCVQAKGKTEGVVLYEPLVEKATASLEGLRTATELAERFGEAWFDYAEGRFEVALKKFQEVNQWRNGDGPSEIYVERCQEFIQNPPKEWNGVYVAKSK